MQSVKIWGTTGLGSWTSLFLIYMCISVLPLNIEDGQLVLYADDINLLIIERDENILQYKL
jgi:hypothetical protein